MNNIIDKILSFAISKKLTVFAFACLLIYSEKITGEQWINISIIYIGTQGVIDAIVKIRGTK